jgi:RimJ/RimL family protein N-acetyltransferase
MTLEALCQTGTGAAVEIAIGSTAPHIESLKRFGQACPFPVAVHENSDRMAGLMEGADLLFCAGGLTALEGCCMGLPCAVAVTAENQRSAVRGLEASGAIINLGEHDRLTPEKIAQAFHRLSDSPHERIRLSQRASAAADGKGATRMLLEFAGDEPIEGGSLVRLRLASLSDAETLYRWQQNKNTRKYFRNPGIPSLDEHCGWMNRMMEAADEMLYLILADGEPAGVIRLSLSRMETGREVSILVDPERYRQGIGKASLEILKRICHLEILYAEVHPDNSASRSLFAGAGFRQMTGTRFRFQSAGAAGLPCGTADRFPEASGR